MKERALNLENLNDRDRLVKFVYGKFMNIRPDNTNFSARISIVFPEPHSIYFIRDKWGEHLITDLDLIPNRPHVYIREINSFNRGYGTFVYKLAMKKAGNLPLIVEAAYSSHIFHIKMGMIPINKSFLKTVFISQILQKMALDPGNTRIDTSFFPGLIEMEMSVEGRERWKASFLSKKPFEPFRKFEHLHSYLSDEQQKLIEQILLKE